MKSNGASAGVRLWARTELRRRWPALVLLGLLAGLASGVAIATVEGSARTKSAYQRMHAQLRSADAVFFPSQAGVGDADVSKLSDVPEVEAWGGFAYTLSQFDEFPDGGPLIQVGRDWLTNIERAEVIAGRLPDPNRDDEAIANEAADVPVGTVVTWRNMSPADATTFNGFPPADFDWSKATGPVTKLKIVGIVRQPMESVLSFASGPVIWVGSGWAEAHLAQSAIAFTNAVVRLRHGMADRPAFERDIARVYGRSDLPVKDLSDDVKRVQRSLDFERTALLLFAAAVITATVVLIGQAFVRSVRACAEPAPPLRALGLGRLDLLTGLILPHVVTIAVGGFTAGVTAVMFSSRFPIGLGRRLDPDLGIHVSWQALAIGVPLTAIAIAAMIGAVAWRAVRRLSPFLRLSHANLTGTALRAGAPIPVAIGTSLALEPSPAQAGDTARPALVAAIVGVLGVVGAITLIAGIDDVRRRPERTGQTWDLSAIADVSDVAELETLIDDTTSNLGGDSDVDAFAMAIRAVTNVAGKGDVPLYSIRPLHGALGFTVLHGRAPERDDEIALGPRTAAAIGAHIGESITAGTSAHRVRVVGVTLLAQTPHTSFDEGALLTPSALESATDGFKLAEPMLLVRAKPRVPLDPLVRELDQLGYNAERPRVPPDVVNLVNVRNLPSYLAVFLVLLAIGATAHALLNAARSRQRDLAVLRALGLTSRQAAACVLWQATIIGTIALLVGIPLGLVVGRQVWRALAESLSFVFVGPLVGLVLLAVVTAAFGLVALMAAWPARSAARLRMAEVLRAG